MFRRLFGETKEEQYEFLKVRSVVSIGLIVLIAIAYILGMIGLGDFAAGLVALASPVVAIICLFVWGMPVLKKFFGVTTVLAFFTRNVVGGLVIFLIYIFAAYFLGMLIGIIGVLRFLYLHFKG